MRIIDVDGVWVRNLGQYNFADGSTGVVFSPGQLVCVRKSDWLALQIEAGILREENSPMPKATKTPKALTT